MSRPNKNGLEYFPLDVNCDDKIKLIDAKFGVEGFGIVIKLWQIIYDCGYFIEWTEKELLLYRSRINADINLINDVINECVKWELFDKKMFDLNVLTSKGIQKRFIEAIKRRTEITIDEAYWLLPFPESTSKCNVHINRVNVCNNSKNAHISTQSKVKERKVKESKEDIHIFGSQKNIKLRASEIEHLKADFPNEYEEAIEHLSLYIVDKGDKSKSATHNATIRRWVISHVIEERVRKARKPAMKNTGNFKQREYSSKYLDDMAEDLSKFTGGKT